MAILTQSPDPTAPPQEPPAPPDGPVEEPPKPSDPPVPVDEPPGTGGVPSDEPPPAPGEEEPAIRDPRVPGQPSRKQVD
jgi:hypothetical protein